MEAGVSVKVGLSSSKTNCLLQWKPFKIRKKTFCYILKALFALKLFKFLSWLFDLVEKTAWLERKD